MYQSQCSFFFKSVIAAKETSEISAMPPKTVEPQPPEEGLVVLTVALAIMVEGLSEAVVSEAELPTMGTVVVTGSVVELDTGSLVAAVASVVATVVAGSCSTESVLVSPCHGVSGQPGICPGGSVCSGICTGHLPHHW